MKKNEDIGEKNGKKTNRRKKQMARTRARLHAAVTENRLYRHAFASGKNHGYSGNLFLSPRWGLNFGMIH